MRLFVFLSAVAIVTGCATSDKGQENSQTPSGLDSRISSRSAQADEVIVGRLIEVDLADPRPDRFEITSRWLIERSLKETLLPHSTITVRISGDQASSSMRSALRPGERFLLLLSRSQYERDVLARGGTADPGVTAASLGLHRMIGDDVLLNPGGSSRLSLGQVYAIVKGETK